MSLKKGVVLLVEGDVSNVRLDNGAFISNVYNSLGFDVNKGDGVIIDYTEDSTAFIIGVTNKIKNIDHSIIDKIICSVESNILERDHPPGSPYFTFLVDDDPNDRYPGTTWVRLEENQYLVSAGSNLVGMTPIGSNTKTLTTSNLPSHSHTGSISSISLTTNSNSHSHNQYYRTSNFSSSGTQSNGRLGLVGDNNGTGFPTLNDSHSHSIDAHGHNLTINNNGSGESFDNRPKSLAIYMWRRIA
nr:hypothetical protein [Methanobrevibacter arboriphilus]